MDVITLVLLIIVIGLLLLSAFSVPLGRFVPGWFGLALLVFVVWFLPNVSAIGS